MAWRRVPGANLGQALDLLYAYDRHAEIFSLAIACSKLVSRSDDVFRVDLRFYMKKVITVVVNTENEARFTRLGSDRAQSRMYSLRVAEVADPGTPQERERPVGQDGGYLWRPHTYWRFLERGSGTLLWLSARTVPQALRFCDRTGVRIIRTPSPRWSPTTAKLHLGSRSQISRRPGRSTLTSARRDCSSITNTV